MASEALDRSDRSLAAARRLPFDGTHDDMGEDRNVDARSEILEARLVHSERGGDRFRPYVVDFCIRQERLYCAIFVAWTVQCRNGNESWGCEVSLAEERGDIGTRGCSPLGSSTNLHVR